jgi:hypothetical protein
VNFPKNNPTYKTEPIDAKTENLLRFDEAKQASWREPDGSVWQGFYCSWKPGRVAGYLAKRHTPDICLPAVGYTLVSGPKLTLLSVGGLVLPIRSYVFSAPEGTLTVFHCRWEGGASEDAYIANESARYNLIRSIWAGRGNHGQKVLEMVAAGFSDPQQAQAALARQLEEDIKIDAPKLTAK